MNPNPDRHRIRLVAAWQRALVGRDDVVDHPAAERVNLPDQVSARQATYTRQFNLPTNLGPNQDVFLCIDASVGEITEIDLNGTTLDSDEPFPLQLSVKGSLEPFNCLRITVASDEQIVGLDGSIRLEIAG